MAKIETVPTQVGDFEIGFSARSKSFFLKIPKEVNFVGHVMFPINTYKEAKEEIDRIVLDTLQKERLVGKVIFIHLATSNKTEDETEEGGIIYDNYNRLNNGSGFILSWYVAEEYHFDKSIREKVRYRIIESNRSDRWVRNSRVDIFEQLFLSEHKYIKKYKYSQELYSFLQNIDFKVHKMLLNMLEFFNKEEEEFLQNIKKIDFNLKLLEKGKEDEAIR